MCDYDAGFGFWMVVQNGCFYHVVCFPAIADFSSCVHRVYTFGRFCDYCLSRCTLVCVFCATSCDVARRCATLLYSHMFPQGLVISCATSCDVARRCATLLYLHMFPQGLVISCFPAVQMYTGRFVYSVCSHLE